MRIGQDVRESLLSSVLTGLIIFAILDFVPEFGSIRGVERALIIVGATLVSCLIARKLINVRDEVRDRREVIRRKVVDLRDEMRDRRSRESKPG